MDFFNRFISSGSLLGKGLTGNVFRASPEYAEYLYRRSDAVGPHLFAVKIQSGYRHLLREVGVLSRLRDVTFVMQLTHWMCIYQLKGQTSYSIIDSHRPREAPPGYDLCSGDPLKCLVDLTFNKQEVSARVLMAFPCMENVMENLTPSVEYLPLMIELMECISTLHFSYNISHGDIHAGNVFLHHGKIVLGDFECSNENPGLYDLAGDVFCGVKVAQKILFGSAEERGGRLQETISDILRVLEYSNSMAYSASQVADELRKFL